MRMLDLGAPVVMPAHGVKLMRRLGFTDVSSLAPGETTEVGGVRVEATAAYHGGKRYPVTKPGHALGYLIGAEPADLLRRRHGALPRTWPRSPGRVDVALLPISGWGFTLPDDHLNPLTAAKALALLRPARRGARSTGASTSRRACSPCWRGRDSGQPRAFARYAASSRPTSRCGCSSPARAPVVDAA